MPGYQMGGQQGGTPGVFYPGQQQGMNPWAAGAIGAGVGGAGALALASYGETARAARVGQWVGIGTLALLTLGGNSAANSANNSMTQANSIAAGANYAQADMVATRNALQQLSTAVQQLSPMSYLGLQQSTQPTPNSTTAASTPASNNVGILALAVILFAAMK